MAPPPSYNQFSSTSNSIPQPYANPPPMAPPPQHQQGWNEKVVRLKEMGFSDDKVRAALAARNGDERAALNDLLGS